MRNALTFVSEFLVFTLSLIAIVVFLTILHGVLAEHLDWPDDG